MHYRFVRKKPSDIIKAKREELGLTQEQAAVLAGVTVSTWRVIERGTIENPTMKTCLNIAKTLQCGLPDIWRWSK